LIGSRRTPFVSSIATSFERGAGAVYLRLGAPVSDPARLAAQAQQTSAPVRLAAITDSHLFTPAQTRATAVRRVREQLSVHGHDAWLVDGLQNLPRYDEAEALA